MYAVSSSFTVLLCVMMAVLIPTMLVMKAIANGIHHWSQDRRANRYIKRVIGVKL